MYLDVEQVDDQKRGEELQLVVLRRAAWPRVDEHSQPVERLERGELLAHLAPRARDRVESRARVELALLRLVVEERRREHAQRARLHQRHLRLDVFARH